jgi:DNA-3-methyladenine glycosylase
MDLITGSDEPLGVSLEPPPGRVVPSSFFAAPSDQVAPRLLGMIMWFGGIGGGRLTEIEAYLPEDDPACHAYRGLTRRNAAMFGPPGTLYVFQSYGVHMLLNLVCDHEGVGSAVLIRSFAPIGDTSILEANRRRARRASSEDGPTPRSPRALDLARGPGCVGQALAVHMGLNGLGLGDDSGVLVIDDGWRPEVACSTRIGISRGDRLPLRFYTVGSTYVSGSRRTRREGR